MGEFENEMVGMKGVQELQERLPRPGLDGLASIIPEAEMHGGGTIEGVEDLVDGLGRKWPIGGITGDICFIYLQARAGAVYSGKNYRTALLVGPRMCRVAAANYRSALLMKSYLAPDLQVPGRGE